MWSEKKKTSSFFKIHFPEPEQNSSKARKGENGVTNILTSSVNICFGYSLELPPRGTSNM